MASNGNSKSRGRWNILKTAFLEAVRVLLEFVPMDCWQQVFGMCNARRSQTTPDEMQLSVAEFATEVKDRLNPLLEREGLVRFESDR